ncbi:MAG: DSD1 family PLP-dependent enzyme [Minwuia sp.]|uniref:DSD1 family PLP-dependent enzyme n=1 Tax=Minwuia sp. TaxID=2493630 RepID=UPI003A89E751
MTLPPPVRAGQPVDEVDTPALLVDLDALERNIALMQRAADRAGVALRPHAKSHKSADIALKQIEAGAVGVCCQKVSEAELLAAGGVGDILVSNQVVGPKKIGRLASLARHVRLGVCVDDAGNAAEIAAAARHFGGEIAMLVEVDVGMGRCGVDPEGAAALCRHVSALEGVRFAGLQAYHGRAQHIRDHGERGAAIAGAGVIVRRVLADLAAAGVDCPAVTGAGTGSFEFEAASGIWTELQCGSYVFMDADYAANLDEGGEAVSVFDHSLYLLAGVVSAARSGRAVVDAGLKSLAVDSGLPAVADPPGVRYLGASDEHGTLDTGSGNSPPLGGKVRLIPGHCDPTVNLHDWYVAVRGDVVEALWPVTARGAVF